MINLNTIEGRNYIRKLEIDINNIKKSNVITKDNPYIFNTGITRDIPCGLFTVVDLTKAVTDNNYEAAISYGEDKSDDTIYIHIRKII